MLAARCCSCGAGWLAGRWLAGWLLGGWVGSVLGFGFWVLGFGFWVLVWVLGWLVICLVVNVTVVVVVVVAAAAAAASVSSLKGQPATDRGASAACSYNETLTLWSRSLLGIA